MRTGSDSSAPEWDSIAYEYDKWFDEEPGRSAFRLESSLLIEMLGLMPGESVLDVGCGTGRLLSALLKLGADARGVDSSSGMLAVAKERGFRDRVVLGEAERLPFGDKTFDCCVFFTSLEFVGDPVKALAEAARVTRKRLVIGFINRTSIVGLFYLRAAKSPSSVYSKARFYSGREIAKLAAIAGVGPPADIRYVLFLPLFLLPAPAPIERLLLGSKIPLGGFGVAAFDVG